MCNVKIIRSIKMKAVEWLFSLVNTKTAGYWSTNVQFCSGSSTSNRAAEGSPWRLFPCETREDDKAISKKWRTQRNNFYGWRLISEKSPFPGSYHECEFVNHERTRQNKISNEITILSTSSKRITGFFTPTVFKAFKILPGIDPIYVRLELINHSQLR